MKRICPKCNNLLKDSDNYFCTFCGQKLDDYLVLHSTAFKSKRTKFIPTKKKLKFEFTFTKNVKIALVIIVGFLFISFLAFYLTKFMEAEKKKIVNVLTHTKKVDYKNTVDLKLPRENIVFGAKDLTKFVPDNVDFYIESVDFDTLFQRFYGNTASTLIKDLFNISLNDRFVLFGKKAENVWSYVIVAEVSPDEAQSLAVSEILSEAKEELVKDETDDQVSIVQDGTEPATNVQEFSSVSLINEQNYLELVGNTVIITNDKSYINEIKASFLGASKNITHNQKYSSFSAYLPQDGQLMFMIFTNDFGDLYNMMLSFNPSGETAKILEDLKAKKFDKFVVRNNE